jgi:predicted Mrr-cat superfamily restriction endonuclease
MRLFGVKAIGEGGERLSEFLKEHYISIGWPEVGDLEGVSLEELNARCSAVYPVHPEAQEQLHTFVNTMQDGDYVLLHGHGHEAYLGDVGDYFYVEDTEKEAEGACHRRGVTWLHRIPVAELSPAVQLLLQDPRPIVRFEAPFEKAQLERWLTPAGAPDSTAPLVDGETIAEAIRVLKEALRSDDPERRERAAAALLQYAKGGGV